VDRPLGGSAYGEAMDSASVVAFPRLDDGEGAGVALASANAGAIAEIDAAIDLVAGGVARRVRLTAIPFVESVAAVGLARARAAGLAFRFERNERLGVVTVTVGPRD
jgi:hypothetical protein